MSSLIGQSLGRYHILEQLGEGGMATVFKAFDTRLERDVAIKIIRKEAFPPEQLDRILKRFEREAKLLARLSHPNIVGVVDYGDYKDSPYLVMEFLPSGTLKQRLGKPIPWQEATRLLLPIARALQFAHKQGIIHRDIKPSNILITLSGEPMLADFGIAKIMDDGDTVTLTGTGVGVGTPEYMAPEQATSKNVDHHADIYSLGVVLYEMITGRKPFVADTPLAVLLKKSNDPLPRPRQFIPNLPEKVEQILVKALAKNPADRYQTMEEFVNALAGFTQIPRPIFDGSKRDTHTDQSPTISPRGKRRVLIGVAAAILLLSGFGIGSLATHIPANQLPGQQSTRTDIPINSAEPVSITDTIIPLVNTSTRTSQYVSPTPGTPPCGAFNQPTLDSVWIWVNPLGDATYSLSENPGFLRLSVTGRGHDLYMNHDAPRLMQKVTGDFIASTQVTIFPKQNYQGAGLLLWQNENNYVRLERTLVKGIDLLYKINGARASLEIPYSATTVYLQMELSGTSVIAKYGQSVSQLTELPRLQINQPGLETYIGMDLVNEWQDGAISADFAFFCLENPS